MPCLADRPHPRTDLLREGHFVVRLGSLDRYCAESVNGCVHCRVTTKGRQTTATKTSDTLAAALSGTIASTATVMSHKDRSRHTREETMPSQTLGRILFARPW